MSTRRHQSVTSFFLLSDFCQIVVFFHSFPDWIRVDQSFSNFWAVNTSLVHMSKTLCVHLPNTAFFFSSLPFIQINFSWTSTLILPLVLTVISTVARNSGCFIIAALFISSSDNLLELIRCTIAVDTPTNLIYFRN